MVYIHRLTTGLITVCLKHLTMHQLEEVSKFIEKFVLPVTLLDRIAWRNLVGVSHTTSEAKAMAEELEYDDEPDDEGKPRKRPGKLADYIPGPYENEQAARAANQGAYPPDLS